MIAMHFGSKFYAAVLAALFCLVEMPSAHATSCTTQAMLSQKDRDQLSTAAGRLAVAVAAQDYETLKASLLSTISSDWDGIRSTVEGGAPLLKNGRLQFRSLYLLDATTLGSQADAQFFCSNETGSMTVTISLRALPPGRYALAIADAPGSANAGQLAFILASENNLWKLAGVTLRPGSLDGHDGLWYWTKARELAKSGDAWSAYYSYETARSLLLPVDFLSSPNLQKLEQEQAQIKGNPHDLFPYPLVDGPRNWKLEAIRTDVSLLHHDLQVVYISNGITDVAAQRTEATAVLSAVLKAQPGLRANFYGLWAYAVRDGKTVPVMELPMAQIP